MLNPLLNPLLTRCSTRAAHLPRPEPAGACEDRANEAVVAASALPRPAGADAWREALPAQAVPAGRPDQGCRSHPGRSRSGWEVVRRLSQAAPTGSVTSAT